MANITKYHDGSMLALHLSNLHVATWAETMNAAGSFKHIKSPINICPKEPTGYSSTWLHKPLCGVQTFTLAKQVIAPKPTHNAWKAYMLNHKSKYRSLWSEVQIINTVDYNKTTQEIRMLVRISRVCVWCVRLL